MDVPASAPAARAAGPSAGASAAADPSAAAAAAAGAGAAAAAQRVLLFASARDGEGLSALDQSGLPTSLHFKSSRVDRHSMVMVQCGQASTQGLGSAGDVLVVAQADRPLLHMYQFGKSEPVLHVHTQEISSCLATDRFGSLLIAGSRKGSVSIWDLSTGDLVNSWQAHFKSVTRMAVSADNQLLVTVGEDGLGRVWLLSQALDPQSPAFRTMQPFRSWNAHTLSVTGLCVVESLTAVRVWTCSLDRHLALYDVMANRTLVRLALPQNLESLALGEGGHCVTVGGSQGGLFTVDTLVVTADLHRAKIDVIRTGASGAPAVSLLAEALEDRAGLPRGVAALPSLHGSHAVTNLCALPGQSILVSTDAMGKACWWDLFTRQCVREVQVFAGVPATNCLSVRRPEQGLFQLGHKASPQVPVPLKKYSSAQTPSSSAGSAEPIASLWLSGRQKVEAIGRELLATLGGWDASHAPVSATQTAAPIEGETPRDGFAENDEFLLVDAPAPAERDLEGALTAAEQRIERLEQDSARWEALCAKMKIHIQTLQQADGQDSEEPRLPAPAPRLKDAGDSAGVVSALQSASSKKGKRQVDGSTPGGKKSKK